MLGYIPFFLGICLTSSRHALTEQTDVRAHMRKCHTLQFVYYTLSCLLIDTFGYRPITWDVQQFNWDFPNCASLFFSFSWCIQCTKERWPFKLNVLKKTTWNLCWYGIFEPHVYLLRLEVGTHIFKLGFGIYRSLASCVQLWRWLFDCGLNLDWVWNNLKASAWLRNDLYSAMGTFHVFTCIRSCAL